MKRQVVAVVAIVVILVAAVVIWHQVTHKPRPAIATGAGGAASGSSGQQGGPQALPPGAAGKAEPPRAGLPLPPGKPPR